MSKYKHRRKTALCPNCQAILRPEDNFCPSCGQENHDLKVPIGHLVYEFFESITHFDTKLWHTTKSIFSNPGKITKDFLEGKRASYVHPVRLYIFVSFVFFFLVTKSFDKSIEKDSGISKSKDGIFRIKTEIDKFISDKEVEKEGLNEIRGVDLFLPIDSLLLRNEIQAYLNLNEKGLDSLLSNSDVAITKQNRENLRKGLEILSKKESLKAPFNITFGKKKINFSSKTEFDNFRNNLSTMSESQLDSFMIANQEKPTSFNKLILRKFGNFDFNSKSDLKTLTHAIIKSVSLTMFILMPVVAVLLLWIFYRKRYYYEHLIFSIHIHTFYFLVASFILLISIFISEKFAEKLWIWYFVLLLIYLIISLKNVYKRTWGSTILRFSLISIPYLFLGLGLFVLAMIYGFLSS